MDRRAFLTSYDATKDPSDEALARVLHAAIPVCYSINLDYYFSAVDNEVYGSGTKLPHNINGLLGVIGETILSRTPLGRLGEPTDIANAALFLCCPASAWISGQVLTVSGGGVQDLD